MTKGITLKDLKFDENMLMQRTAGAHTRVLEYSGHKSGVGYWVRCLQEMAKTTLISSVMAFFKIKNEER